MKKLFLCILLIVSEYHLMYASLGCLHDSYDLQHIDYKEWHIVENCTCDCEASHKMLPGGLCEGCMHRHTYVPLNAHRNMNDAQDVLTQVNLDQLSHTALKKEVLNRRSKK